MELKTKLKKYLKEIESNNFQGKKINAILQVRNEKELLEEAEIIQKKIDSNSGGLLAGNILVIKANINMDGMNCSCASKVLENYVSPYNASVIDKIRKEDGLILGIANMDEFACGGSGETSAFGVTQNPRKLGYIPGGSSSGSVASVCAGFCDMALGSDTGGSIRNPSSHCGVVGVKPTYGSVSRYGLIDLSMSLDQIGPIANSVKDAALLLKVISGRDEFDSISEISSEINLKNLESIPKKLKIGLLDFSIQDKRIQNLIGVKIEEACKKYGFSVKKIKPRYVDLAIETYYPLVYVEFFSGTRRFDGRRYGRKIEDFAGPEVLRRVLGGGEITKAEHAGRYYNLSLKAKGLIEKEFSLAFKDVDCIISPVVPRLPHKIGEKISVEEMYSYDALTIPSNLAGNCAISIPVGEIEGFPIGMQIMCDKFQDEKMLQIARAFEKL